MTTLGVSRASPLWACVERRSADELPSTAGAGSAQPRLRPVYLAGQLLAGSLVVPTEMKS